MSHNPEEGYVAVLIRDMIFASRIREAARRNGVRVEFVKPSPGFAAGLTSSPPAFFIVDLGARNLDPFAVIREIREDRRLSGTRVIGFLPHVETGLKKEAAEAGYDLVAARSWMAMNVEKIFADFAAGKTPPAGDDQ